MKKWIVGIMTLALAASMATWVGCDEEAQGSSTASTTSNPTQSSTEDSTESTQSSTPEEDTRTVSATEWAAAFADFSTAKASSLVGEDVMKVDGNVMYSKFWDEENAEFNEVYTVYNDAALTTTIYTLLDGTWYYMTTTFEESEYFSVNANTFVQQLLLGAPIRTGVDGTDTTWANLFNAFTYHADSGTYTATLYTWVDYFTDNYEETGEEPTFAYLPITVACSFQEKALVKVLLTGTDSAETNATLCFGDETVSVTPPTDAVDMSSLYE